MAFKDYLTAEGERLLAESIAESAPIKFTKLVMGSGYLAQGTSERNVSEAVTPVKELPIDAVILSGSSTTVISAYFSNEELETGFYFREKAIYMQVGTEEVVGIYGNAGSSAEYIDTADVCVVEKLIRTVLQLTSEELANVVITNGTSAVAPIINDEITLDKFVKSEAALAITAGQMLVLSKTVYYYVGGDQTDKNNYTSGVKLSDVYDSEVPGADATGGIAASQNALHSVYFEVMKAVENVVQDADNAIRTVKNDIETLQQAQEQTNQSLSAHEGKVANNTTSGHVKLNSEVNASLGDTTGYAATPLAVKTAYDKAGEAGALAKTGNEKANSAYELAQIAGEKAEIAESIAKGRNQTLTYETYEAMVEALNTMAHGALAAGQNIYIKTVGVPDVWIYSTEDESTAYTYTNDAAIAEALANNAAVQMGYYKIAQLETQKVDLTEYAKKEEVQAVSEEVKGINDTLTASNGIPFNFAYNSETGEYGHIVTDSEGADTFHPFCDPGKLYEALQYSGLVTEDMTFEEMCAVLAEVYPDLLNLVSVDEKNNWTPSGYTTKHILTSSDILLTLGTSNTSDSIGDTTQYLTFTRKAIDITSFNILNISGTATLFGAHDTNITAQLDLVSADNGTRINLHYCSTDTSNEGLQNDTVNITKDISNLSGNYYIVITLKKYGNWLSKYSFTKFEFLY